jgi:uncharacterized damage-inducible protein DinB
LIFNFQSIHVTGLVSISKNPQSWTGDFLFTSGMKSEIQKIQSLLKRTFESGAWHGPAVKEALAPVTQEIAMLRLPNTHSIIELVSHMTSWRNFTIKRLGEDPAYQVSDEMNFPTTTDWSQALRDLEVSQQKLLSALDNFPELKLSELVPHVQSKYTFYTLLHGIIHHDLYHIGQIMLIRKATAAQSLL